MIKEISLALLPNEIHNEQFIEQKIKVFLGSKKTDTIFFQKIKESLDARKKPLKFILKLLVFVNESEIPVSTPIINYKNVSNGKKIVIVGAGPSGLFCALRCIELGMKPILFERGKNVKDRRRDLALLNKKGVLNEESNYCFGEGGAGTYSDGKLYTRSNKRGNLKKILNCFIQFGASPDISFKAHPHIGTNKLPNIIESMREKILDCGGEIYFEKKLTDIYITNKNIVGIEINNTIKIDTKNLVLATGHSARDIYYLLREKGIALQHKDFAIGVRIEHPQQLMNEMQYGKNNADDMKNNSSCTLEPASYSMVEQVEGRGVFTFCMCPGGIIAPASTENNSLVVNGWSPSKRNNPFANSGLVTAVGEKDFEEFRNEKELAGLYFQQKIEQKAFEIGGGNFVAPAQNLQDFLNNRVQKTNLKSSYHPGLKAVDLASVFPAWMIDVLRKGIKQYAKKVPSYVNENAVLVATESRTSSPVRIPRNEKLEHIEISGLYPCAEGAGYAGGIISAAMDGERVADAIFNL